MTPTIPILHGRLRPGSGMSRSPMAVLALVLGLAAWMGGAGIARATYPGANGAITFEVRRPPNIFRLEWPALC